jgi:hypothetical protein
MLFRLAGALLLAIAVGALAGEAPRLPPKVTLFYDVKMAGFTLAEAVETLEHDGNQYRISSEARGKGVVAVLYRGAIRRTVQGAITPQGLRPAEFEDQRGDRPPARAAFDWGRRTVTQSRDGKAETVALPEDATDRLSFFYQFAFVPLPARELRVTAIDGRGMTRFHFQAGVREKLATPLGELDTIKLVKVKDGPDDKGTEVWLAPAFHYLPVRVLVTERNGDRADQIISRIEQ